MKRVVHCYKGKSYTTDEWFYFVNGAIHTRKN